MNERESVCVYVCVQEIIFGGQLLGGGIKCLWNEVLHASKASSIGIWTGGLTQTARVFFSISLIWIPAHQHQTRSFLRGM